MNELRLSASEVVRFKTDTRCPECEGTGREWDQQFTGYPCLVCDGSGRRTLAEWVTVVDTLPMKMCEHCENRPARSSHECPVCNTSSGRVPCVSGDVVTITGPCELPCEGGCAGSERVIVGVGTITNIEPPVQHREGYGSRVTLADVEQETP